MNGYARACWDHFTKYGLVARKRPLRSATRRSKSFLASTTTSALASIAPTTDGNRSAHSEVPANPVHGFSIQ